MRSPRLKLKNNGRHPEGDISFRVLTMKRDDYIKSRNNIQYNMANCRRLTVLFVIATIVVADCHFL